MTPRGPLDEQGSSFENLDKAQAPFALPSEITPQFLRVEPRPRARA
jgi:hypothetical protein